MLEISLSHNLRVGVKQSIKAMTTGNAVKVFIARDAEQHVIRPIVEMAAQFSVPIEYIDTMKELGKACKIDVGAATAVLMKTDH
jgi:large subunit ribosomal protein L7A